MKIYVLIEDGVPVKWARDYKFDMAQDWKNEQPGRELVLVEESS